MVWIDFIIVLFLGWSGVHKFMQKNMRMGVVYLFTFGILGIGWLYDCYVYFKAALNGERVADFGNYKGKRLKSNSPLPIVNSLTVPLKENEVCHYIGSAMYQTSKNVVTGYTGRSKGFNIKVAKGISYRTGGHASQAIRNDVVEQTKGTITITNQRVIFTASKGAFDVNYKKISSIAPHSDGIIVQIGSKSYTLICKDSLYIYQIIMRVSSHSE